MVDGVIQGHFVVLKGEIDGNKKSPVLGQGYSIPFNATNFIGHPDPNIDVTAMNVSSLIGDLENNGSTVFWKNITNELLPTEEQYEKFVGPMEDIVFVGYPSGIWDAHNILPVARKGMTATPCYIDFEGEKKFLVDASVFPGSSGSPVFIYYAGGHSDRQGNMYMGNRIHFVGIMAKVFQRVEQGDLKVVDIPTEQKAVAEINQMIDLGIVYKAETVLECCEHYIQVVTSSNNQIQPTQ